MRASILLTTAVLLLMCRVSDAAAQSSVARTGAQAPGAVFRDCAGCPEMVVVPAGSFLMGSPESEPGRHPDEGPQHQVSVRAFAIGRSHVTRGQFGAFVRTTNHQTSGGCYVTPTNRDPPWELNPRRNWQSPGFAQTDQHPAVCISWDDAQAYVRWLSQRTGRAYRLPSEAEYEYAARAGTTAARFWGDAPERACAYANVADLTAAQALNLARTPHHIHLCRDGYVYTAPVARFRANRFGLHDMLGNAWQWVEDCHHDNYVGAPGDGSVWTAGPCEGRVARGGSWRYPPRNVRAGSRLWDSGFRYSISGFRVARTS